MNENQKGEPAQHRSARRLAEEEISTFPTPNSPRQFIVVACDADHVILSKGARNGCLEWDKVALSDLPEHLACRDDLVNTVSYGLKIPIL